MFLILTFLYKAMYTLLIADFTGSLLSELLVAIAIMVVLFIVFKVGKGLFKLLFGIVTNSVLGLLVIFAVNRWLGMGIPYTLAILLPTAIFGLPGIGTIILLKLMGVPL